MSKSYCYKIFKPNGMVILRIAMEGKIVCEWVRKIPEKLKGGDHGI